ncbi:MAG: ECF transporter S component [Clostridia bacterium]
MKKKAIIKITVTGVFIALLVALQWGLGSISANNQFVVGSAVNLVLIVAAVIGGIYSGICVAVISPFLAFLLGIGPQIIGIVPFIALGNVVLTLIWSIICAKVKNQYVAMGTSLVVGSVVKCLTLYLSIVKVAVVLVSAIDYRVDWRRISFCCNPSTKKSICKTIK